MTCYKSITIQNKVGCGTIYVSLSYNKDGLKRVAFNLGKQGTCPKVLCDVITGLINDMLKIGWQLDSIIRSLNNHHCAKPTRHKKGGITYSCADGIAQALKEFKDMKLI